MVVQNDSRGGDNRTNRYSDHVCECGDWLMKIIMVAIAGIVAGVIISLLCFRVQAEKKWKKRVRAKGNREKREQEREKSALQKRFCPLSCLLTLWGLLSVSMSQ